MLTIHCLRVPVMGRLLFFLMGPGQHMIKWRNRFAFSSLFMRSGIGHIKDNREKLCANPFQPFKPDHHNCSMTNESKLLLTTFPSLIAVPFIQQM